MWYDFYWHFPERKYNGVVKEKVDFDKGQKRDAL